MANVDIRIAVSFRDHRKRKRLRSLVGPDATDLLLDLWIATAMNHPSGVLRGMDDLDIALEAGWDPDTRGEPSRFVSALVACGLLERLPDGDYALHDWNEHQAYAVHARERSQRARAAASARWNAEGAEAMPAACAEHAVSMPGAMPTA